MAACGLMALAILLAVNPQCLGGPYGELDPWLQDNWIANITEAKPLSESILDLPAFTIAVGLPVLLGLAVIAYRLWRSPAGRPEWAALLAFALCLGIVMLA